MRCRTIKLFDFKEKMHLTIEDMRKFISSACTWLTIDDDLRFFKDERNQPMTENSKRLTEQLEVCSKKCRTVLFLLSDSIEETSMCRKNLRSAIEKEKEIRERNKKEK